MLSPSPPGTARSTITTTGKHGIAIFAQSVGGGGGLVRTMTTDETFDPSKIVINPQGRLADVHGFSLNFGGQNGIAGDGGDVNVFTSGPITTSGLDAHAILAQSIGGGGGMVVGGQITPSGGRARRRERQWRQRRHPVQPEHADHHRWRRRLWHPGPKHRWGWRLRWRSVLRPVLPDGTETGVKSNAGNGGAVSVACRPRPHSDQWRLRPGHLRAKHRRRWRLVNYRAAPLAKSRLGAPPAARATAVLSRSHSSAARSTHRGWGRQASSPRAMEMHQARSRFRSISDSSIRGGQTDAAFPGGQDPTLRDVAGIRLMGGTGNEITNAGIISSLNGLAILTDTPKSNTLVTNTGTISGNIVFSSGAGNVVDNRLGGVIDAPTTIDLSGGQLRNAGTLQVGGAGTIGKTTVTGDFVQSGTGITRIDVDARNGQADLLEITGQATLAGTITVNPISTLFRKGTTGPVITAAGGFSGTPAVQGLATPIFSQTAVVTGNALMIATNADFHANDAVASAAQRSLAGHLQQIWEVGSPDLRSGVCKSREHHEPKGLHGRPRRAVRPGSGGRRVFPIRGQPELGARCLRLLRPNDHP